MTVATDRPIQLQELSLDECLAHYGEGKRHELIDREVFDLDLQDNTKKFQPSLQPQPVFKSTTRVYRGLSFSALSAHDLAAML